MHDASNKKNVKKEKRIEIVAKIIKPENVIKISSVIVQVLLAIGLIFVLAHIILIAFQTFQVGLLTVATEILENSLLIIVFFELYLSAIDFFRGKGRSVIYVMDATISFLLREIIIGVFSQSASIFDLLGLGGIIGIISLGRYAISRTEKIKGKKRR